MVTSVKGEAEDAGAGDPAARHRKVTASARVTELAGEKVLAPVPVVTFWFTAHCTASA